MNKKETIALLEKISYNEEIEEGVWADEVSSLFYLKHEVYHKYHKHFSFIEKGYLEINLKHKYDRDGYVTVRVKDRFKEENIMEKEIKTISGECLKSEAWNTDTLYYVKEEKVNKLLKDKGLDISKITCEEILDDLFPWSVYYGDVNLGDYIDDNPYVFKNDIGNDYYILQY